MLIKGAYVNDAIPACEFAYTHDIFEAKLCLQTAGSQQVMPNSYVEIDTEKQNIIREETGEGNILMNVWYIYLRNQISYKNRQKARIISRKLDLYLYGWYLTR